MGSSTTIIFGNVGREPQMRYMQDGRAVCDFSVAVNKGKDKPTQWFKVTAWEKLAEICNLYVTKGAKVQVTGTVKASAYLDQRGQPVASLEITASDVQFASSPGERTETGDSTDYATGENLENIPF